MNAAVVALVVAAPVVKLGPGSAVSLKGGLLVTTHAVVAATARPFARLEDGGSLALGRTLLDDAETDLALVLVDADLEAARFSAGPPDAGTHLTVLTGEQAYDAIAGKSGAGVFELDVPDAGEIGGAAVVDSDGTVWGVVRDGRSAFSAVVLSDLLDTALGIGKPVDHRLRNLGISAAFFLGLSVWWVYRSKRRRY